MPFTCGHCSTRETKVKHDTAAEVRACSQRPRTLGGLASGQQELRVQPAGTTVRPAAPSNQNSTIIDVHGVLHEGYFTVVFDDGERRTLRVRKQRKDSTFRPGDTLISFLSGPANEADYTKCAAVQELDGVTFIRVWRRFRESERLVEALKVLAGDPQAAAKAYAEKSGNCSKCNLLLTVPQGPDNPYRDMGYGPKCGAKIFG